MTKTELLEMVNLIDRDLANKEDLDESLIILLTKLRTWWTDVLYCEYGIRIHD